MSVYERIVKRLLDIIIASIVLVLFGWLYLIIAILVRIKLGKPVLFSQQRPGVIDNKSGDEKIFLLYKFRTMTDKKDKDGNLLPDNERLTKFGRILRSTSLDELPEMWNILRGDMSLVGPRPLLMEYLPYYTKEERKRHSVRPGLTGLAQIEGRNYLTWEKRFAFDLEYVENCSFGMDMKIILKTVSTVLLRKNVADRTLIITDTNGERFIIEDGIKKKYPRPLNIERSQKN